MAFSDDGVRAKLSALNESQDSIVSVAQWIMFYRRYADRAAQLWLEKVKESNTSKKLNLIYLANEIMQQAKVRKKDDFLNAFMPIIAEATSVSYKGATQEVQQKIRRVVEVWRQRAILDTAIQDATEARIDGMYSNSSLQSLNADEGLNRTRQVTFHSFDWSSSRRITLLFLISAAGVAVFDQATLRSLSSRDSCSTSHQQSQYRIR